MQKYCRKMKKRRVNFSLLRANEVGNTEALLSICGLQSLKYARRANALNCAALQKF